MTFKQLRRFIKSDLKTHGAKSFITAIPVYLFSVSFRLLLNYRIGKYLYESKTKIGRALTRYYTYRQLSKWNCQLSFKSDIGLNVKFPHPIGIVIGDGVVINDDVRIWQHVTFGSHGKNELDNSYPIVQSGARIFTGAVIIGKVLIGANATIGANAVVNIDVPDNCIAVGIPAKVISK